MAKLELVERLPDETDEEYFLRACLKAGMEQRSFIVEIRNTFVDVTPGTTVEYLKGYVAGLTSC